MTVTSGSVGPGGETPTGYPTTGGSGPTGLHRHCLRRPAPPSRDWLTTCAALGARPLAADSHRVRRVPEHSCAEQLSGPCTETRQARAGRPPGPKRRRPVQHKQDPGRDLAAIQRTPASSGQSTPAAPSTLGSGAPQLNRPSFGRHQQPRRAGGSPLALRLCSLRLATASKRCVTRGAPRVS